MLRQALRTPSRAVRSAFQVPSRRPLLPRAELQFRPIAAQSPLGRTALAARHYSTEQQPAGEGAKADAEPKAASEGTEGSAVSEAEATLKKQVETKEKEALDWKVRFATSRARPTRESVARN